MASRETVREADGAGLRLSEKFHYDGSCQLRVATLRYEIIQNGGTIQSEERPWLLRWYVQEEFRRLLWKAGFESAVSVRKEDGEPAKEDDPVFVFIASRRS